MAAYLRSTASEVVIGGDFNAASMLWGARASNLRGDQVEVWAASLDLRVMNIGKTPTCVRSQGTSIVDVTWCTPGSIR